MRLVMDFYELVSGKTPSISCTLLEDSLNSNRLAFAADEAMESGKVVLF